MIKEPILYVDDNKENLTSFRFNFISLYVVYIANSAEEGLKVLEENEIKVIISDQKMPGMTGVDFLAITAKKYPDILRLILTGYSEIDAIIRAINEGHIYRYLSKPWNKDELKVTIDNALRTFHLKKENKQLIEDLKEANKNLESKVERRTVELSKQKKTLEEQNAEIEKQRSESEKPKIAFIGVLISWLILDRKAVLSLFDSSACSFASTKSLVFTSTNFSR